MLKPLVLVVSCCALFGAGCAAQTAQNAPGQERSQTAQAVDIPAGTPAEPLRAPAKQPDVPASAQNIPRPTGVR